MTSSILAFDLATATGMAFGRVDGSPVAQTFILGGSGSKHGARFTELRIVLRKLIRDLSPDHIAIEEAIAGGAPGDANRAKLAFGLRAIVLTEAFIANIPVTEIAVASIRKHFIGRGNLPAGTAKPATIARCEQLGWRPQNDNEADALAAWDAARNRLSKNSTLPPNGLFEHGSLPKQPRKR